MGKRTRCKQITPRNGLSAPDFAESDSFGVTWLESDSGTCWNVKAFPVRAVTVEREGSIRLNEVVM
jgi:hypothetical protein